MNSDLRPGSLNDYLYHLFHLFDRDWDYHIIAIICIPIIWMLSFLVVKLPGGQK